MKVLSRFIITSNTEFTVCKINETDFVAKNNDFLDFAESLVKPFMKIKI